jgi:glycosyltransferase involved in cell wall biosynthesis
MSAALALRRRAWVREVGLFAACYLLYSLARGVSRGSEIDAVRNAGRVVALQAQLGLNVEGRIQSWLSGLHLMEVLGALYLLAQLVAVPVALFVMYRRRRALYPVLRTTLLAAWVIAIPIYALFPTAPPRLAGIGILDSVSRESLIPLDASLVTYFYNPVAAVPSMHAAFAVAVGVGLAATFRGRLMRGTALTWGPIVIIVVLATGNHFVLDVVAGLLVLAVAFGLAVAIHGAPWARTAGPRAAAAGEPGASMRVAIVCPYAWDRPGGVVSQVRDMAAHLRTLGHHVDVFAPSDRTIDDGGVHRVGGTAPVRHNGSVGYVGLSPLANLRAIHRIGGGAYDVVHLHEPLVPPCLGVLLFSRSPLIGTFHMYGPDSRLYRTLAPLGRLAVRRLHHRTAVSEAAAVNARLFLGGRCEVVPNGVVYRPPPANRRRTPGPVRVLFVGRGDPRKGLGTLIAALETVPAITLDLVGIEGDDVDALRSDATAADGLDGLDGLDGRIVIHGRVSDEQRRRLLDDADILCAPSLGGESFGLVLVEAMAAGVPVIASAIPGYADVVGDAGVMVPPGDVPALATALRRLADDALLRDRLRAAGITAAARFDWSSVAPRIIDAYETATARHADIADRLVPDERLRTAPSVADSS